MTTTADAAKIVDAAIAIAEAEGCSWERVRLHDVAAALDISLDDIRTHFREKEDLMDAWFDRADEAMLQDAATPGFLDLSPRERLNRLILAWLGALGPHRQVTRQMILAKCEPGHLHIQIPAVMRISRTVQWMREAAHQNATFLARALEETALTSLYLATFIFWLQDESEASSRTRALLDSLLGTAEGVALWLPWVFGDGEGAVPK
jgi:AcrR family transcriptional regulator